MNNSEVHIFIESKGPVNFPVRIVHYASMSRSAQLTCV